MSRQTQTIASRLRDCKSPIRQPLHRKSKPGFKPHWVRSFKFTTASLLPFRKLFPNCGSDSLRFIYWPSSPWPEIFNISLRLIVRSMLSQPFDHLSAPSGRCLSGGRGNISTALMNASHPRDFFLRSMSDGMKTIDAPRDGAALGCTDACASTASDDAVGTVFWAPTSHPLLQHLPSPPRCWRSVRTMPRATKATQIATIVRTRMFWRRSDIFSYVFLDVFSQGFIAD